jgi:hypothetical protein
MIPQRRIDSPDQVRQIGSITSLHIGGSQDTRRKPNYIAIRLLHEYHLGDASRPWCDFDPGEHPTYESQSWLDAVLADGQILKLEDGSLWKVDPSDTVTSALWLPISDVIVCDDTIVNVDDEETVHVRRLR